MKQLLSISKKDFVFLFLLLLFIGDTVYSYYQHSLAPVDGDLAALVVPSDSYKKVLTDPFGLTILQTGESYPASNRFFVQWATYAYFRYVPLCLQHFISPIDSVYASMAIAKTILQAGLILLLASYITLSFGWKRNEWILAAVLISPFFQTAGFFEYLCFIDPCSSYAFAYALSTLALMIFLFPYYRAAITGRSGLPLWIKPLWLLFPFILTFSGPLISPVLLILCPSTLIYLFYNHWRTLRQLPFTQRLIKSLFSIHWQVLISFSFTTLLCLYSLYIGTHNSENLWTSMPLMDRYKHLFEGIIKVSSSLREGLLPIGMAILFNLFILRRFKNNNTKQLIHTFYLFLFFTIAYILLLPLGGYRSYRPFIIRRDTLQPVLWILFFSWGISSVYILKNTQSIKRLAYTFVITSLCLIYTLADKPPAYTNACERQSMAKVASSSTDCIELEESCTLMQWDTSNQCADALYPAELLYFWNISPRVIYYHHKP